MNYLLSLSVLIICATSVLARTGFTGYSGAPTRQTCAMSCHGQASGTVVISGFPAQYVPNQTYALTIQRLSGNSIRNFNASCRIGTGSENAGLLGAGTGTQTYSVEGETNGVHLSSQNQASAMFNWTAPAAGTGTVRLYCGAYQGTSFGNGLNSTIVLVSDEALEAPSGNPVIDPQDVILGPISPNPFNSMVRISYTLPVTQVVRLSVTDVMGRELAVLVEGRMAAGSHTTSWAADQLVTGMYFLRLDAATGSMVSRLALVK